MKTTIKNGVEFQINAHGLPLFEGRPLGCLGWGHPAQLAWFGEHYRSVEAWDEWWSNWKPEV
jgi:hypothetical protein